MENSSLSIVVLILENTSKLFMKDTRKFIPFICIYFDLVAFSTVVAFNRFQERGFIHIVAFHRLALVRRGNNLGGISQYNRSVYIDFRPPKKYLQYSFHVIS